MQANHNMGCSAQNMMIFYNAGNKIKYKETGCQEHIERLYCSLLKHHEPCEWVFKTGFQE